MVMRGAVLPLGALLEQTLEECGRWSRVSLLASMKVGLDVVAPQSLDRRRMLRYTHRDEVPSGAMVASSVGSMKFMQI
jgi:hypothetical protein